MTISFVSRPSATRTAFLVLVPVITGVVLLFHPAETPRVADLQTSAGRWLTVHVAFLVMLPLLGITLWMLLDGVHGPEAKAGRLMILPFVAFYAAFESMVGIGTGVLLNEAETISTAARQGADALAQRWWDVPMPVPLIAAAAILSWVGATGTAALAHVRGRSALLVPLGFGLAAVAFALGHPGVTGALGMAGLVVAALSGRRRL